MQVLGSALLGALAHWSNAFAALMSTKDAVIPRMGWEEAAADALGIRFGQMRYVIALFLAVPLSGAVRGIRSPTARQLYSVVVGLLLVLYPFGRGVIQIVFPVVTTYLAMLLAPHRAAPLAWVFSFGYLVWLQVITASGLAWNQGEIDFVGAIMILTLKLISMATCRQDGAAAADPAKSNPYQAEHRISRMPRPLQYLSFVFGLGNLLAGPPIEYTEFNDFIELRGVWDPKSKQGGAPLCLAHGTLLLLQGVGFMCMHILLINRLGWGITGNFWFRSAAYKARPPLVRLGCHVVCGFAHQVKYYFLWKLSESANVFSGFDFDGWSPEEGPPAWGRCTNVRFLGMWLSDSARIVPQHWNIRTGIFLKRYVYERVTGPGGKAGFVHVLITQLVAAFWHGVYPGYLIFFTGTVFYLHAASVIYRAERSVLPPALVASAPWWLLKVVWTDVAVCYMAMAFVLLDGRTSLEIHADVYFVPHLVMLALCLLGVMLPGGLRGHRAADGNRKNQ